MTAKVTTVSATPESWGRPLESREILYDPVHAEMIGADPVVTGKHEEMPWVDDVGALQDVELVGEEVPIMATEPAFREYDLVGDDTDEQDMMRDAAYEGSHEDGEESPDGAGITDAPEEADSKDAPTDVVQMGPESSAAGPSTPPTFGPASGPTRTLPTPRGQARLHPERYKHPAVAAKTNAVKKSIAHFRARIHARDPHAVKALFHLQAQAKTSPTHAAVLKAVANANLGFHFGISGSVGQVLMSGTAHGALTKILSLALSPVAWATHGVGTVAKGAGRQLEKLSRKL